MKHRAISVFLLTFVISSLVDCFPTFNFKIRPVQAISVSDIEEEITTPSTPYGIGVDSSGNIYYGDDYGNLYKSTDNGASWTCVFNSINTSKHYIEYIFVDSNDNAWFVPRVNQDVYKYNGTCTMVFENAGITWHWDEASNGSIYVNPYADGKNYAYRTSDQGNSWSICFNTTDLGVSVSHLHSIKADSTNDEIYVVSGDDPNEARMFRYNGSWYDLGDFIRNGTPVTDIWFDDNHVYFGGDSNDEKVVRMAHSQTDISDYSIMVYGRDWDSGPSVDFVRWGETVDDLMFFVTRYGEIWSSWDGEHWYMLYQNTGYSSGLYDVPERKTMDNAYVFADPDTGKILKFYLDKKVLVHLFYQQFTSESGGTVTYEHVVGNGTNYIDLGNNVISNPTLKLVGVDQKNWALNGSFESGTVLTSGATYDPSGWHERYNKHSLDSSEQFIGSQSLKVNNTKTLALTLRPPTVGAYTPVTVGRSIYVSMYVKANISFSSDAIRIYINWRNSTDSDQLIKKHGLTTSWEIYTHYYIIPSWATEWCMYIGLRNYPVVYWFDGIAIDIYDTEVLGTDQYDYQYITVQRFSNYTDEVRETWSPSITIGSNTYSHSGELSNQTESESWSLDVASGITEFTATIYGSGQVKVKVDGTRACELRNALVRSGVDTNIYEGTYYGVPEIEQTTNLFLLVDKCVSLVSASPSSNNLTFVIDAYTGYESTTYLYYGGRGKPQQVKGASDWEIWRDYAKIIVYHGSQKTVVVSWGAVGGVAFLTPKEKHAINIGLLITIPVLIIVAAAVSTLLSPVFPFFRRARQSLKKL